MLERRASYRVDVVDWLIKGWKLIIEFGYVEVMILIRVGFGGVMGWKYKWKGLGEKNRIGWGGNCFCC